MCVFKRSKKGMIFTMENQLIVYTPPKKKKKKVIILVVSGILVCVSIFLISAFCGASFRLESTWNKTKYVDLKSVSMIF